MPNHRQKRYRLGFIVFSLSVLLFLYVYLRFNTPSIIFPANEQWSVTAHDSSEMKPQKRYDLQSAIEEWSAAQNAQYSIVIYDPYYSTVIGSYNDNASYFAASLYKLYVAYLTLIDFQSGIQDPNELLIYGQTKKQCVEKMIRSSDSACGEALMADIGQQTLNQRVKEQGYSATRFDGIVTSAADCVKILSDIVAKKDLSDESTAFLLDAMTFQDPKFKRGLAAGAPNATWATKVGWNEDYNYHDIGIMTLEDNRQYIIAVLSQGNGSPLPIANFASMIYTSLND